MSPLTDSQRQMLTEATGRYAIVGPGPAAEYLGKRGIDLDSVLKYRLGVVGDPLPEHVKYKGCLAIPFLAHDGHPLSMRFRCMQDHNHDGHGKYMGMAGERTRPYGIGALHSTSPVVAIAEGELDALVLNKLGIPAVGIAGAQAWKPHYSKIFAGFSRVLIYGDPDEAGAELVQKIVRVLSQATSVRLTVGDVTDTYLREGAMALYGPYAQALKLLEGNVKV